ncbi:hypothetical protein BC937DRAFT_94181 [Endogone sp. FLAS-F59071]|nr:hypothetical protein BC937DRAFT_94181 [Endogone sp. FLAS-F59071]|eukprot:RUS20858.1 hypothetical protein BC937DRAFT_94181 [Endogone sp. FLAS-F59071]
MQDIIKQAFTVAEIRVKERQLQQQQQRQHLNRDRSHGGMGGGHTNDGAESKLRNMNVALPLDSQRQAMSRQRMETQREQRQNRPDRNGKDGKDSQAQMTPFENPLYKTRLCERFETEAYCPYGPKCTFAHGTTELRERPQEAAEKAQANGLAANKDGPENPLYKTRLCERFMKENFCQYGPKCNFAHGLSELRERPNFGNNRERHDDQNREYDQQPSQRPSRRPRESESIGSDHSSNNANSSRDWRDTNGSRSSTPAPGMAPNINGQGRHADYQNGTFGKSPTFVPPQLQLQRGVIDIEPEVLTRTPEPREETRGATPEPVVTAPAHAARETSPGDTANSRISNTTTTGKPVSAANTRRRGDDANVSLKEFLSGGDQVVKEKSWMKVVELSKDEQEKMQTIKKPESPVPAPMKLSHDEVIIADLKKFFAQHPAQGTPADKKQQITEDIKEVTRVEMRNDMSKPQLFSVLFPALLDDLAGDASASTVVSVFRAREKLFKTFIRSTPDQLAFIRVWEKYVTHRNPHLVIKSPVVFKLLYDDDWVEEEVFLKWYQGADDGSEVKKKCGVFIGWLQTAEEEDE